MQFYGSLIFRYFPSIVIIDETHLHNFVILQAQKVFSAKKQIFRICSPRNIVSLLRFKQHIFFKMIFRFVFFLFSYFFQNISPFGVIMYGMLLESVQHFVQVRCMCVETRFCFYVLLTVVWKVCQTHYEYIDQKGRARRNQTALSGNSNGTYNPRCNLFIVDLNKFETKFLFWHNHILVLVCEWEAF